MLQWGFVWHTTSEIIIYLKWRLICCISEPLPFRFGVFTRNILAKCVCVSAHSCGGVYLVEWAWLQWSIAMQHKSPAWEPSSHQASKLLTKCSIPHVGSDWLLEYDSIFHVEAEMRKSSQKISIKERHNRIIVMTFRHWELILMCDCCWCNETGGAWMPACSDSHYESWVSFILRMLSHEQSVLYLELRRS